jgi:hemerythrin-like domain-containing protein
MNCDPIPHRRRFLAATGAAAIGLTTGGLAGAAEKEDVSPAEDLMREHGILKRVILIYRESIRRMDAHEDLPTDVLSASAKLIRSFVEDYHEKLEQDYLFPRFRKAGKLVDLVDVLETQHKKGRILTDVTLHLATSAVLKDAAQRGKLRDSLEQFIRMYEPHEAREDTILFPAFHELVSKHEYDALGEDFEKKENQLFGGEGFEKNVAAVAALEKKLGIYDLAQFTPKV